MNSTIKLAIFDVDGVMTDGRLVYTDSGEELKSFHARDGLGLKALMQNGIEVAIMTARESPVVTRRARELGINHVLQGCSDKGQALEQLLARLSLSAAQCAYAGDDLVDWPAMRQCAFKCAPADAAEWIRRRADFISVHAGGRGAVRDICERILATQGLLDSWRAQFT